MHGGCALLRCDHAAFEFQEDGRIIGVEGARVARYPSDFRLH